MVVISARRALVWRS